MQSFESLEMLRNLRVTGKQVYPTLILEFGKVMALCQSKKYVVYVTNRNTAQQQEKLFHRQLQQSCSQQNSEKQILDSKF